MNAPGQEDGAATLAADYEYPSMEQLSEQVQEVLNHFKIVKYIGIGVGLGANVLTRHALSYPERVECMMLINTCTTKAGWLEWGYQKRNISHMRTTGITQTVLDYLLWHHLGDDHAIRAHDLLQVTILHECNDCSTTTFTKVYKDYFSHNVNAANLAPLVEQYIWRSDISLTRDISEKNTIQAPVLNLVGIHAAAMIIDETVTFNGRLTPTKANWMKIQVSLIIFCTILLLILYQMKGGGYDSGRNPRQGDPSSEALPPRPRILSQHQKETNSSLKSSKLNLISNKTYLVS